uniref:Uncharacterized protein n=1 Tax=Cucumis melo TaxID=3656 RepID=A0A9I9DL78_CUCME
MRHRPLLCRKAKKSWRRKLITHSKRRRKQPLR